jgi:hypothetical protein
MQLQSVEDLIRAFERLGLQERERFLHLAFHLDESQGAALAASAALSAEARLAVARPAEARPSEARPAEPRPSVARPSEARPSEARPSEVRPSEARPSEDRRRPSEDRPSESRPSESRPSEARPQTLRAAQHPWVRTQLSEAAFVEGVRNETKLAVDLLTQARLRAAARQDNVLPDGCRAYAVWSIPEWPGCAGVHYGRHPETWNALSRRSTPNRGPVRLMRCFSLEEAETRFLAEARSKGLPETVQRYWWE